MLSLLLRRIVSDHRVYLLREIPERSIRCYANKNLLMYSNHKTETKQTDFNWVCGFVLQTATPIARGCNVITLSTFSLLLRKIIGVLRSAIA